MKNPISIIAKENSIGQIGYGRFTKGKEYKVHKIYINDFSVLDDSGKMVIIKDNGCYKNIINIIYEED